eukprot:scaffold36274_cov125-Isochrysis_galbana.AAC.5
MTHPLVERWMSPARIRVALLAVMLAPALAYDLPAPARLVPRRVTARVSARMGAADSGSGETDLNMGVLASRIERLRSGEAAVRVFDFDAMVPGQRLALPCPSSFADICRDVASSAQIMCMVGRHRLNLHSHGVEVTVESISEKGSDGDAMVILQARRFCQVLDVGEDQGSRWAGRTARARWVDFGGDGGDGEVGRADGTGTPTLELSAALEPLVQQWIALVRSTGSERAPGQLEGVLSDLGPMPAISRPNARALWVVGLINPLPALGVALEVRPAALMAATAEERLKVAEFGIRDSIKRLSSSGAPF